jgi:multiple sugar transport system ATP-binding protein
MAELRLSNISKVYPGNVTAVSSVNLAIRDREFVVLVGPSGCGKSTLLRMIAGLEDITSGDLHIDGKRVNDIAPKDRDIAMVFQNYALYPHMSVAANMGFGLKLRKFPRKEIERRVGEAAEVLGLTAYLDRKPKALSGGQRQRVALGRAIVRMPKVFLFDEPLSNLDARMRVQMRSELCRLHAQLKATMVYVTHDQVEAMTMGERIVVMNSGVVQQVDTPERIYHCPANEFTAGFIGSPPMNLFKARIRGGRVVLGDTVLPVTTGKATAASASNGGDGVTVGIRPHDLRLVPDKKDSLVTARVELFESLGGEAFVHCSHECGRFVASVDPYTRLEIGTPVMFTAPGQRIMLFDTRTGMACAPVDGALAGAGREQCV